MILARHAATTLGKPSAAYSAEIPKHTAACGFKAIKITFFRDLNKESTYNHSTPLSEGQCTLQNLNLR